MTLRCTMTHPANRAGMRRCGAGEARCARTGQRPQAAAGPFQAAGLELPPGEAAPRQLAPVAPRLGIIGIAREQLVATVAGMATYVVVGIGAGVEELGDAWALVRRRLGR